MRVHLEYMLMRLVMASGDPKKEFLSKWECSSLPLERFALWAHDWRVAMHVCTLQEGEVEKQSNLRQCCSCGGMLRALMIVLPFI